METDGRGGFVGEAAASPTHQLGDLGSGVNSPSGVRGEAPAGNAFWAYESRENG